MNIFGTVMTYAAPSANYRGESELNRLVMQRITRGRFEYPVVSPEAMRNALRETLRTYKLPCNRERLTDEEQLAVRFEDFPYPERYVDDFFFGYLVADRKKVQEEMNKREPQRRRRLQFKRDSILRMNLAVGLEPYRHDALLTQSPLTMINPAAPWQNATSSALLNREVAYTAFQYPFALNLADCRTDVMEAPVAGVRAPDGEQYTTQGEQFADWLRYLLRAESELSGVAGNHARSLFTMQPASIILRVTPALAPGFDLYPFRPDGSAPDVVDAIVHGDIPGSEFILGGQIVTGALTADQVTALTQIPKQSDADQPQDETSATGGPQYTPATLFRTAEHALDEAARRLTGRGLLDKPGRRESGSTEGS